MLGVSSLRSFEVPTQALQQCSIVVAPANNLLNIWAEQYSLVNISAKLLRFVGEAETDVLKLCRIGAFDVT